MQRGNIMIHRYHLDDFFIVIDTCSGSVHVVDEIAYEIIGCYEQKSREEILPEMACRFGEDPAEIAECYDQITELKEQGTLFSPDVFEPLAGELKKKTAGVVKKSESRRWISWWRIPAAGTTWRWTSSAASR